MTIFQILRAKKINKLLATSKKVANNFAGRMQPAGHQLDLAAVVGGRAVAPSN
jgi:hypothetical protein